MDRLIRPFLLNTMTTIEDKNIPFRRGQSLIQVQLIYSLPFATLMKKTTTTMKKKLDQISTRSALREFRSFKVFNIRAFKYLLKTSMSSLPLEYVKFLRHCRSFFPTVFYTFSLPFRVLSDLLKHKKQT